MAKTILIIATLIILLYILAVLFQCIVDATIKQIRQSERYRQRLITTAQIEAERTSQQVQKLTRALEDLTRESERLVLVAQKPQKKGKKNTNSAQDTQM